MSLDGVRADITAFEWIKRLACRLLGGAHGVRRAAHGTPKRRTRRQLARRRASDVRAIELARQLAARRAGGAAAVGTPPAPALAREAVPDQPEPRPRLDVALIGRHCRQVFPARPTDGLFDDLLRQLESLPGTFKLGDARDARRTGDSPAPMATAMLLPAS